MEHGGRKHAKYGGSGAHRYVRCPASIRLSRGAKRLPPTAASKRGTRAHELLEFCLRHDMNANILADDDNMAESVQTALDYVLLNGAGGTPWIERYGHFPQHVVPRDDAAGLVDVAWIDGETLVVLDYKNGERYVHHEENWQGIFYAATLFNEYPFKKVRIVIVQPNAHGREPVREWEVTAQDFRAYTARIVQAIADCEKPDAPAIPGDWCRHCPAGEAMVCEARQAAALDVAKAQFADVRGLSDFTPPSLDEMPLDKLGYVVANAGKLRSWLDDAEKLAMSKLREGYKVPGVKLVLANARRRYAKPLHEIIKEAEAISCGDLTADDIAPRTLVPLTRLEQMLSAAAKASAKPENQRKEIGKAKAAFAMLTEKDTSGAITMVSEADPRPAVDRAASAFAGVTIPPMIEE